jgi:hypothetical protein
MEFYEGSGIGGTENSYLTDGRTYTQRVHNKDQGKDAVNWLVLDLLK